MADKAAVLALEAGGFDSLEALDSVPHALLILNGSGLVLYANSAAEELFGQSRDRLVGAPGARAWGEGNHQVETALGSLFEKKLSVRERDVRLTPGGKSHQLQLAPFGNGASGASLALALIQPDAALAGEGAGAATATMAAVLAHEVKNPLAGIRGAAQLLEHDVPGASRHLTRVIQAECDRILSLVERMDMLSNPPPEALSALNIHEILDHVLALETAASEAVVQVEKQFDPSLPPVLGDRDLLVQLLLNLVRNAFEAAHNPRLVIRTRYRHGGRSFAADGKGGSVPALPELPLEITIADNGPGIEAALLPHIFEPFVTGKPGGKGLGLALVKKFTSDLGGRITAENTDGGALFRLCLKRASAGPRAEG